VLFAVADSCGGVPDQDLPRLFETGFRGAHPASSNRPAAGRGAGLGLAIVQGIVHAHGGAVSVRNTGHGCEFVVALPTVEQRSAVAPRFVQPSRAS
jgi:signal transduction histidine kinase